MKAWLMNWLQYLMWLASAGGHQKGPTVPGAQQPKPVPVAGAVFDDFDGVVGSTPNPVLWEAVSGKAQGVSTSTPDNISIDGRSNLVVSATDTATGWTAGWLDSIGAHPFGYGTFSASIKMPAAKGMDCAFWLHGSAYPPVLEPQCGEIDIIEYIGDGKYYSTVHGPMYGGAPWNQTQVIGTLGFDPSAAFHTYWCQHLPGIVNFGVDGTRVGTATPKTIPGGAPWVCDQPFNVMFCIVVGNGMSGKPTVSTPSPAVMLVDWFYWQPSS
jgi:beta-glucanase (GH16 family)